MLDALSAQHRLLSILLCHGWLQREIAAVVELSLIGLDAFAVEGVGGWVAWGSRLAFAAGVSVTFFVVGVWQSPCEQDASVCCSELLVCEPVHDVGLAGGCQV